MREGLDFYKVAAVPGPLLQQWIRERRQNQLMSEAIDEICKDNNMDPKTATVGDFLKLGGKT